MKFGETLEVYKNIMAQSVDIVILKTEPNGNQYLVKYERSEEILGDVNQGMVGYPEPTIRFAREHAQAILDGLWKEGMRPNDGNGSMAHTEALKEQIEMLERQLMDWRHLAYYHMEVPPPEEVSEAK